MPTWPRSTWDYKDEITKEHASMEIEKRSLARRHLAFMDL